MKQRVKWFKFLQRGVWAAYRCDLMTPYNYTKLVTMATIRSPILRGREIVRFYK